MKYIIPLLVLLFATSCSNTEIDNSQKLSFDLSGEMLFEGANTLQAPAGNQVQNLASVLQIAPEKLQTITVSSAQISIPQNSEIVESLLLQIVSNNMELVSVGTLSPLPEGKDFKLSLAEEMDLKPYLLDEGATWVLDLNLSEDYMDELRAQASISLKIKYQTD